MLPSRLHFKHYLGLGVLLSCFSFQNAALASQLLSTNTDVKVVSGDAGDLLVVATPNSQGVSSTAFTEFSVDRPLKIINTRDAHGNPTGVAASLIVIQANNVNLSSGIEIIGETADILIVGADAARGINCRNCSFTNAGRVTVLFGQVTYSAQGTPLDLVPFSSTYALAVNGLTTSSVGEVELVAKNIALDGNINTQMRANLNSDGSYQLTPSGGVIVGAGGINLFAGYNLDYQTLTVKNPNTASSISLPSSLSMTTQAVRIESAGTLTLSATINTQSDVNSPAIYRKKLAAIQEAIKIYVLGEQAGLNMNGNLISDNLIELKSAGELNVNGNVRSKSINYAAGETAKLNHRGSSQAFADLILAGGAIENNGQLRSLKVYLAGINDVQNRFGGKILGDVIEISSQKGLVRNGSQYPFKQKDDLPLLVSPTQNANLSGHFATLDLQVNGLPLTGATRVNDLSAFILGKSITIFSSLGNVENINPYFEYTLDPSTWVNGVIFDTVKSSQVQLVADDYLGIRTNNLLLNSSAILGVNNINGKFQVNSPYISNERYTTQAEIQQFNSSTSTSTTTGIETDLYTFSPPGIIYSFSPLSFGITITNGGFVNNTSYFEVLNNATITSKTSTTGETAQVTSIGLQLSRESSGSIINENTTYSQCVAKLKASTSNVTSEAIGRTCGASSTTYYYSNNVEQSMKGTLFSVAGNLYGASTQFYGTNHDLMNELKNKQIEIYNNQQATQNVSFTGGYVGGSYSYIMQMSLSADKSTYEFYKVITSSNVTCASIAQSTCDNYKAGVSTKSSTQSVADYFASLIQSLKTLLTNFANFMKGLV